jgi:predicted CoA-binding protein
VEQAAVVRVVDELIDEIESKVDLWSVFHAANILPQVAEEVVRRNALLVNQHQLSYLSDSFLLGKAELSSQGFIGPSCLH